MQADPISDAADILPDQIIEDKIKKVTKLKENKIGDYEKLEGIKKSLINDGAFSQSDNNYLEEKYEEYENLESKDEKGEDKI